MNTVLAYTQHGILKKKGLTLFTIGGTHRTHVRTYHTFHSCF